MLSNSPDFLQKVYAFHKAFRLPLNDSPESELPTELTDLRFRLLEEENLEYLEACKEKDIVKIADALGDILYVLAGTIVTHGLQDAMAEIFDEIHRSNMSKLDENGNPLYREDGKIMKSPAYFRPDLKKVLKKDAGFSE